MDEIVFTDGELAPVRRYLARAADAGGKEPTESQKEAKAALRVIWSATGRVREARFDNHRQKERGRLLVLGLAAGLAALGIAVGAVLIALQLCAFIAQQAG